METRSPRRTAVAIALTFTISAVCFTLFVWHSFGGVIPLQARGYQVHVSFGPDAAQLTTNAQVRIAGVRVGKVVRVSPRGRRIDATLEIDKKFAPIPADAHAIYRVKTLLGESFIELSPGTPHGPRLPDGGRLRSENVEAAQPLADVLGTFDPPTRRAFKRLVRGLDVALRGRGPDVNAALGHAGPSLDDLGTIFEVLDRNRPALRAVVRDGAVALSTIGRHETDVARLLRAGDRVLATTARRDRELLATVRALPPFLSRLRTTLGVLEGTQADAAPVLRALRPAVQLLRPAIERTTTLAPQARAFFRELEPVITAARRGLPAATRIVDAARPVVDALDPAGSELVPTLRLFAAYRREIVSSVANSAAATNGSTRLTDGSRVRYVRVLPTILSEQTFGYGHRLPTNRYNPYPVPGALDELARGGLLAWSCRHTSNPVAVPLPADAPPCLAQPPWRFGGAVRSYPHVARVPR
jgi:virulence factor Mce-like protein